MFPTDEKQEVCEKMRQLDRQRDKTKQTDGSPVALFNFFVQRVREQLHIVLAMSPIGDAFRNRIRKFPSLVNCCTIDWFQVCSSASRVPVHMRLDVLTESAPACLVPFCTGMARGRVASCCAPLPG